jgi:hypothetical protein
MSEIRLFTDKECKRKAPGLIREGVTEAQVEKLYYPKDAAVILAAMRKPEG